MYSHVKLVTLGLLSLLGTMASAAEGPLTSSQVTTVFQYNDTTFVENLTILPDGRLLLVPLSGADLVVLDPREKKPTPATVLSFPLVNSVGAITQVGPDQYAIIGGNHSFFSFEEGSMKVFVAQLDTKGPSAMTGAVTNIISVPDTTMLNGIVALPNKRHVILSHDSIRGRLFRVDTRTNEVKVISQDPIFGRGGNDMVPLGANGIEIRDGFLYFTNSAQGKFVRVVIDEEGYPVGEFETVAQLEGPITLANAYDDFTFDNKGNAYVTLHPGSLTKITPEGKQTIFSGGGPNSTFLHPTSAVLANEGNAIYVSTGGDWENGVGGGGQILKVKLRPSDCQ